MRNGLKIYLNFPLLFFFFFSFITNATNVTVQARAQQSTHPECTGPNRRKVMCRIVYRYVHGGISWHLVTVVSADSFPAITIIMENNNNKRIGKYHGYQATVL